MPCDRNQAVIPWACSCFPTSTTSWRTYSAFVASLARLKCKWGPESRSPGFSIYSSLSHFVLRSPFEFSLRLLRFNRRLSLLHLTLTKSARQLLGFLLMASFVFIAFTSLFYLLFHPHLEQYSTWLRTSQTCFEMIALHFSSVNDMIIVNPLVAGLCLFLFIFLGVFLLSNMFVSIIVDNFNEVRRDQMKRGNEVELLQFVMNKMKQFLGKTGHIDMSADRTSSVCFDRTIIQQTIRREICSTNCWLTEKNRCIDVCHRQSKFGWSKDSLK